MSAVLSSFIVPAVKTDRLFREVAAEAAGADDACAGEDGTDAAVLAAAAALDNAAFSFRSVSNCASSSRMYDFFAFSTTAN